MRDRYRSLRKAMKFAGLSLDQSMVVNCDHTWHSGATGMLNLLNLPNPPTAVLSCNDAVAIGALKSLIDRGLQAGRDISLVGFDDLTICQFTRPSLTTIRFSPQEIAGLAFRALLDDIQHPARKTTYEYKTSFVLRESTGAPRS